METVWRTRGQCHLCPDLILVMVKNILSYDPPTMNLMSGWDMNTCWPAFTIDTWNNNETLLQPLLVRQLSCNKTQFKSFSSLLFPLNTITWPTTWTTSISFDTLGSRFWTGKVFEGAQYHVFSLLQKCIFHLNSLRNGTRDTEFLQTFFWTKKSTPRTI